MQKLQVAGALVAGLLIVLAAVACGSGESGQELTARVNAGTAETPGAPDQDAFDFIKTYIDQAVLGQWGRQWETLHPGQQEVVTRNAFMDCRSDDSIPEVDVEEVEQYDEQVDVEGVGSVPSTAVTVRVTSGDEAENMTVHAIAVDGEWRWTLPADDYKAYAAGDCPV